MTQSLQIIASVGTSAVISANLWALHAPFLVQSLVTGVLAFTSYGGLVFGFWYSGLTRAERLDFLYFLIRSLVSAASLKRLAGATGLGVARGFAAFAGLLVRKRHAHLREAWLGDLRRESGEPLSLAARRALRASIGYLVAAVRIRLQDTLIARSFYRFLNYVLSSRSRTRAAINMVLGAAAVRLFVDQGFDVSVNDVVAFPIMWAALDKGATWLRKRLFPQLIVEQDDGSEPKAQ